MIFIFVHLIAVFASKLAKNIHPQFCYCTTKECMLHDITYCNSNPSGYCFQTLFSVQVSKSYFLENPKKNLILIHGCVTKNFNPIAFCQQLYHDEKHFERGRTFCCRDRNFCNRKLFDQVMKNPNDLQILTNRKHINKKTNENFSISYLKDFYNDVNKVDVFLDLIEYEALTQNNSDHLFNELTLEGKLEFKQIEKQYFPTFFIHILIFGLPITLFITWILVKSIRIFKSHFNDEILKCLIGDFKMEIQLDSFKNKNSCYRFGLALEKNSLKLVRVYRCHERNLTISEISFYKNHSYLSHQNLLIMEDAFVDHTGRIMKDIFGPNLCPYPFFYFQSMRPTTYVIRYNFSTTITLSSLNSFLGSCKDYQFTKGYSFYHILVATLKLALSLARGLSYLHVDFSECSPKKPIAHLQLLPTSIFIQSKIIFEILNETVPDEIIFESGDHVAVIGNFGCSVTFDKERSWYCDNLKENMRKAIPFDMWNYYPEILLTQFDYPNQSRKSSASSKNSMSFLQLSSFDIFAFGLNLRFLIQFLDLFKSNIMDSASTNVHLQMAEDIREITGECLTQNIFARPKSARVKFALQKILYSIL